MPQTRKPLTNKARCKQDYYLYDLRLGASHELPAKKTSGRENLTIREIMLTLNLKKCTCTTVHI